MPYVPEGTRIASLSLTRGTHRKKERVMSDNVLATLEATCFPSPVSELLFGYPRRCLNVSCANDDRRTALKRGEGTLSESACDPQPSRYSQNLAFTEHYPAVWRTVE
jgi:hypothetical protein